VFTLMVTNRSLPPGFPVWAAKAPGEFSGPEGSGGFSSAFDPRSSLREDAS
jgi:hypothetical protein